MNGAEYSLAMKNHYIFDPVTHETRPAETMIQWLNWFELNDRRIKQEEVGCWWISTVFLGFDHSFCGGPPILFETMVFDRVLRERFYFNQPQRTLLIREEEHCRRCCTYEQALEQHAFLVALYRHMPAVQYILEVPRHA